LRLQPNQRVHLIMPAFTKVGEGSFASYPGRHSTLTVYCLVKDQEFLNHLFDLPFPDGFPVFEGAFLSPLFFAIHRPPLFILISELRELARL